MGYPIRPPSKSLCLDLSGLIFRTCFSLGIERPYRLYQGLAAMILALNLTESVDLVSSLALTLSLEGLVTLLDVSDSGPAIVPDIPPAPLIL